MHTGTYLYNLNKGLPLQLSPKSLALNTEETRPRTFLHQTLVLYIGLLKSEKMPIIYLTLNDKHGS